MQLADLTPFDIQEHLEEMRDRGLSVNSEHTRLRSIRAWCNWMVRWQIIDKGDSPVAPIRNPKLPQVSKGFISQEQFQELLALCPQNTFLGARRQAVLWLLATSGMRISELAALKMADLDWDGGIIWVRKGKGQKERWEWFQDVAQMAVLRYLAYRDDDLDCLWVSEERTPIKRVDSFGYDIHRLMKRAGVQVQDRCHVFRRTYAAQAVMHNVPREAVQAALGWSSPTMLNRYVKALERNQRALEALRDFKPFR